jgi:hypothetical protein|uniref:EF-hand domain-containing protein n=1 Tax=viral metagenome TaxID=1070528 RepID=A0A6C0BW19_9ZZZZ
MALNKLFQSDKIFAAVILIILNIGSKNIDLTLSPAQKKIFSHDITKQILIFSIAWVGSREIKSALLVTCVYIIVVDVLMNTKSRFNLLPESLRKLEHAIDTNSDGHIDDDELNNAIKLLEKLKK